MSGFDFCLEEIMLERVPSYCFYKNMPSGHSRHYFCTHCGCDFIMDLKEKTDVYTPYYGLEKVHHRDRGNCPCCDYPVTFLAAGKFDTASSLNFTDRIVYVNVISENEVELHAYYVNVDYSGYWKRQAPYFSFDLRAVYKLTPGSYQCFLNEKHYSDSFDELKEVSLREPFNGFMYNPGSYTIVNEEDLDCTFLCYVDIADFSRHCQKLYGVSVAYSVRFCTFLAYAAKYPQIEFLMKNRCYSWVSQLVYHKCFCKRFLNWNELSMRKFFKMRRDEFKDFARTGFSDFVLMLWYDGNKSLDFKRFASYIDVVGRDNASTFFSFHKEYGFDYDDMVRYVSKGNNPSARFALWRDYIRMASALCLDFADHNTVYPKELSRMHDNVVACSVIGADGVLSKAQKALLKQRINQYEYASEGFFIHVPTSPSEIFNESRMQKNCVKGYAERHFNGVTTVLFLREKKDPTRSFFTIEVRDGEIRQCCGYHNDCHYDVNAEAWDEYMARDRAGALAFKNEWWAWVQAGSPRDGNGNPIKLNERKGVAV